MVSTMTPNKDTTLELMALDHPSGLTPLELAFCRLYAQGGRPAGAYLGACSQFDGPAPSPQECAGRARVLLAKPAVTKYVQHLIDALEGWAIAKKAEIAMFLTSAIRTPIDQINGGSVLCQKKREVTRTMRDGGTTQTVEFEGVSKMAAVAKLCEIMGYNAPTQVDVSHSGGVMVVPMPTNLENWEDAAGDSQANLMADALDL